MPSLSTKIALAGATLAAKAAAHGLVQGFATDGVYQQGYILDYYYEKINTGSYPDVAGWYEESTDNGFISPDAYTTGDIICNKNAENANATASVTAGGTVDFYWTAWPSSHIGPVLTYVANCGTGDNACTTVDKTKLEWVKIDEAGINLDTQTWASTDLIANNNSWSVTVPSTLATGSYVFRHEIIAMHGAGSQNGAQNYPFCINIAITGGGSDSPDGTLGTALYTPTDPGILFNPYTTLTNYTIPGPALYSGGSDSTGSSGNTSSTGSSAGSSASASATAAATATGSGSSTGSSASAAATSSASTSSGGESSCTKTTRKARRHARDVKGLQI
ncbi:Endoglucanase-7 [Cytospora mali]|uniref:lytic cellulose monooxygenase (C4-dehydrogenating) n=1 Tax=Cytospora mali TaxID=578113 RepID=A0A194VFL1_CYTMA|nr:Endoglucanase-7 [Valsa mali var. pyri (nom. inval.)]